MTILEQRASDVRIQEINLSTVITSNSTAVGCQVVVAKQGSPEPKFFTNADDYIAEYGNPDASVSFDVYCGLDFFREGNALWARRAVHNDALYAGLLLYSDGTTMAFEPITAGIADPENPDWESLIPSPTDIPIALFWPKQGPGSFADELAASIVSNNIDAPTNVDAASVATGGSMVAGTYQYSVSALGKNGETLASVPAIVVIAGVAVTNSVTVSWDPIPLAIGYRVYGRLQTSANIGLMAEIGQGTYEFLDTGSITPNTARKPITNPADLPPPDPTFTVNLYDERIPSVESYLCTLGPNTDDTGMSTELEERINPFSVAFNVTSNVSALVSIPPVNTVDRENLAGGTSGSAPTSFDVAAAYDIFKNKQLYRINTLINGGHANPTVQLAMDTLSQGRGDTVGMLDVPSAKQRMQDALNYRNLELNLNSSYSALFCPDVLEADNINGKQQYVPFSGWAAALCARTDRVANPSFSIAGLNRGLVNVLKTRYTYDDGQATQLFKAQVNYTRTFIGQGIALWEQQTLSAQQSALSWISVRRIVNVIKTSLYQFLLYSLQEPNDDFTGRQIVGSCSDYLELIKNARGLTSYQVISDTRNNSAAMFNSGIRRVTVIIVPTIPIHEIQLQIVISKQGVSFEEVLTQVTGQG
jgi:hypothetical protein